MTDLSPEALAVLEKVKKLFALAQNNNNENEAAAASEKAMELLAAYNLDMAMISTKRDGPNRSDKKRSGGLYGWQRDLWEAVCEINFCMYWSIRGVKAGSKWEHRILGRQENVIGAEVMADYLQQTVERLAQAWAKSAGYASVFVKEAIAYREGMARRLTERLNALRADRIREDRLKQKEREAASRHPSAAPGTGLVLASVINSEEDLNYDYLQGLEPGTNARQRAERLARQAAAMTAYEKTMREREEAELRDPSLKAARLRREAADQNEWVERIEKAAAQQAKRDAKRGGPAPERYRAPTAKEERERMHSFGQGYRKAEEVGLDQQITKGSGALRLK